VVCVHPGGPRLVGVGTIRAAFEALFNQSSVKVTPMNVRRVESLTSVVHSVLERIDVLTGEGPVQAWVVATNVYHRTGQGWRLVLHHASPGTQNQATDAFETPTVLH
jgi:ketosteroid isomerase-like protein